jgi:hypothetical protein
MVTLSFLAAVAVLGSLPRRRWFYCGGCGVFVSSQGERSLSPPYQEQREAVTPYLCDLCHKERVFLPDYQPSKNPAK